MLLKIWKKYWQITAHLNFNFWYCKPILKAIQGQKLEISCSKWTFCHMLEQSMPYSSPFSPAQHNCWERGVFQHVADLLGTGIYFFLKVNEGNYKNWGEGNHLWTCSNYLEFFPDFLLLQNPEFWADKGPFSGEKTKRCGRRRYYTLHIALLWRWPEDRYRSVLSKWEFFIKMRAAFFALSFLHNSREDGGK